MRLHPLPLMVQQEGWSPFPVQRKGGPHHHHHYRKPQFRAAVVRVVVTARLLPVQQEVVEPQFRAAQVALRPVRVMLRFPRVSPRSPASTGLTAAKISMELPKVADTATYVVAHTKVTSTRGVERVPRLSAPPPASCGGRPMGGAQTESTATSNMSKASTMARLLRARTA